MDRRFYHTSQFARKAGVSVRTLRYYDKVGLLSPSWHTEAGHRLYTDADFVNLQQILALKFLGFSLIEIKAYMQAEPQQLQEVLAKQKAMLFERRTQLDTIIQAIEQAEKLVNDDHCNWEPIVHVIQVIQMEQNKEWVDKYFTPEQRQIMEELGRKSYGEEARRKMAGWGDHWTEEDQQRVDRQYASIAAELRRLVAEGQDPASPEAQAVAKLKHDLELEFTQGDADIAAGLQTWWKNYHALPDAHKPPIVPWNEEEGEFLAKAAAIYEQRQRGTE